MADEVFYSEGKLVSGRGPGIARTALAGSDELFFAEITSNFTSSSGTYIDVTGLTGTMTVPEGPYVIEAFVPVFAATAGVDIGIQVMAGSSLLVADGFRVPAANIGDVINLKSRIPNSMHSPAPGSVVTYKAQIKSGWTTTDVSVFVDFAGRLNVCYLRGART